MCENTTFMNILASFPIFFFRFMHLLPIPFIAILLISFGISTLLVHLKLDTSTICFQVIKVGYVGLKGLFSGYKGRICWPKGTVFRL